MTYANPEQPVLRTASLRPSPDPREARNVRTRLAAASVSEMAILNFDPPPYAEFHTRSAHPRERGAARASRPAPRAPGPTPPAYREHPARGADPAGEQRSTPPPLEYADIRAPQSVRLSQCLRRASSESAPRLPRPGRRLRRAPPSRHRWR